VVVWGTNNFNPSTLMLNDAYANTSLILSNSLDLNGAARTISVGASAYGLTSTVANAAPSKISGACRITRLTSANSIPFEFAGFPAASSGDRSGVPAVARIAAAGDRSPFDRTVGDATALEGSIGWGVNNVGSLVKAPVIVLFVAMVGKTCT